MPALPLIARQPPGGGPGPGGEKKPPPQLDTSGKAMPAYTWVLAWVIVIGLLAFANQTEIGHTIIYYTLVLILVLLLLTQYQFISSALAPIGTHAPAD